MYVYMYMYINIYLYVCRHIYIYVYVYRFMLYVRVYIYVCICMCICVCVYICIYMYVYMYAYINIYTCIYIIYIYMCVWQDHVESVALCHLLVEYFPVMRVRVYVNTWEVFDVNTWDLPLHVTHSAKSKKRHDAVQSQRSVIYALCVTCRGNSHVLTSKSKKRHLCHLLVEYLAVLRVCVHVRWECCVCVPHMHVQRWVVSPICMSKDKGCLCMSHRMQSQGWVMFATCWKNLILSCVCVCVCACVSFFVLARFCVVTRVVAWSSRASLHAQVRAQVCVVPDSYAWNE